MECWFCFESLKLQTWGGLVGEEGDLSIPRPARDVGEEEGEDAELK